MRYCIKFFLNVLFIKIIILYHIKYYQFSKIIFTKIAKSLFIKKFIIINNIYIMIKKNKEIINMNIVF